MFVFLQFLLHFTNCFPVLLFGIVAVVVVDVLMCWRWSWWENLEKSIVLIHDDDDDDERNQKRVKSGDFENIRFRFLIFDFWFCDCSFDMVRLGSDEVCEKIKTLVKIYETWIWRRVTQKLNWWKNWNFVVLMSGNLWVCFRLKHERKMNSGRKWKDVERVFTVTHTHVGVWFEKKEIEIKCLLMKGERRRTMEWHFLV